MPIPPPTPRSRSTGPTRMPLPPTVKWSRTPCCPALADALYGIADQFADVPPVGRLAIVGGIADAVEALESFMGPVIVSQTRPGEQCARVALDLTSEGYKELAEQAGAVARTVTEARECGCGNLHPCWLADGSALFVSVEQGKPSEFRLAPWWQGEGDDE